MPSSTADPSAPLPSVCCVVSTLGQRPAELQRTLRSALDQRRVDGGGPLAVEVVVVADGVPLPPLPSVPDGSPSVVRGIELPQNLGIPGARNAGIAATTADLVLVLDDDGWLPDDDVLDRTRRRFAADPRLGIVSLRIVDPESGTTLRRHVPRIGSGDPMRSSEVTIFQGGACVLRRTMLADCARPDGPLPGSFVYGHEETDLAWRALDHGWRIRYQADAVMNHPATTPDRHAVYYRLNARNRVWVARRNLPAPLVPVYLGVWAAIMLARLKNLGLLRTWWAGFVEGWRTDPGLRRPIRWRTVWRMTRLGRPPVI
ncbi:MAG TPA: glycosyltransferase [Actinomycetales bacterium]|nr:glycosyltransferase [Actinomycetales bacterium]